MPTKLKDKDRSGLGLFRSIVNAFLGLCFVLRYHYKARLIFILIIFVALFGLYLGISRLEMFILGVTIMMVFIVEIINTLVEQLANLITAEFNKKIKVIKDMAAGMVLLSLFFSLIVLYFIFVKYIIRLHV